MDPQMLHTLEYDRIIDQLIEQATSETGKKAAADLQPALQGDEVKRMLQSTAEAMDLLRLNGNLSLEAVSDIRPALQRARIGGLLSAVELLRVAGTAGAEETVCSVLEGIDREETPLSLLRELSVQLRETRILAQTIRVAIDEDGEVTDDASPKLSRIRRNIHQLQGAIRNTLDEFLRNSQYQKMLQDPIVTQRNDRYVIPVKQEYRGAVRGIVHDQSASGQTLFIEPQAVVDQNNRLRELELEEEREVERILRELSMEVADKADELENNLSVLTELDLIMAKARLGRRLKGIVPGVNTKGYIHLKKARHPLIPIEEAVPNDVELGREYQAMVITGPNTGGKTVTLKTVGLLALMAQSGLPIPAEEESDLAIFTGVYADIGDEQSIEQNLSTFSSHMTNIVHILDLIDENSLVLLDELGAGTDPTEGAALAISILERILEQGCRLVATTHYNELKLYAHARQGVINASVEFDVESLSPTYRLLTGVPGRSNAFEISRRLGLPEEVIQAAKSQLSSEEKRLEEMIGALSEDRRKAERERAEAEDLRQQAEILLQDLKLGLESWDREKERIRESARREARSIVSRAKREADEVLEQLRRWAREQPGELKEHRLIEAKKRLDDAEPETVLDQRIDRESTRQIQIGDEVLIRSLGQKGQVIDQIGDREFQVQVGIMKMKVSREQLEWKGSSPQESPDKGGTSYRRQSDQVRPELDLRGRMVEEAIPEIDKYLDDALLTGFDHVSLIHGKGTGALRTGVRKFLDQHPRVKSYRSGGQGEGGLGVTVVELS